MDSADENEVDPKFIPQKFKTGTQYDTRYKVVMIGNSGVGKTSLLRNWCGDTFIPYLTATVGIDFADRIYDFGDGRMRLSVWDTAGQERYGTITSVHYRDAKGLIFVYDITDQESFERLSNHWLKAVDDQLSETVPIVIVGNKSDLSQQRQVSEEDGRRFADRQGASYFIETSARTGKRIFELFYNVAVTMGTTWGLKHRCKEESDEAVRCLDKCHSCGQTHGRKSVLLTSIDLPRKRKESCCA